MADAISALEYLSEVTTVEGLELVQRVLGLFFFVLSCFLSFCQLEVCQFAGSVDHPFFHQFGYFGAHSIPVDGSDLACGMDDLSEACFL